MIKKNEGIKKERRVSKTRAPKVNALQERLSSSEGQSTAALKRASHLVDEFCETLQIERSVSHHTIRAYATDLKAYLRWCKRMKLDPLAVNHQDLRRFFGELDQAQYARSTINRHLSSVRGFFRWLTITGEIDADPASVLQGPKQNRHLPHVISATDMVKLLSVHAASDLYGKPRKQTPSDIRDQAILEFLYACGARISEASGLLTANVDFSERQVKVFGKGKKERIIPLHDLCIDSMKKYYHFARPDLLGEKTSKFFFISTRGNQMGTDALRKMFKQTVRQANLDDNLSPHDMRHTFATDMLNGGADLRSVQEMLGHTSLSTTQIYTHLSTSRLQKAHAQAHPRAELYSGGADHSDSTA